jgi:hypothetical protein
VGRRHSGGEVRVRSDEYKLNLQGQDRFFWLGSEAGLSGIFDFPGILAGGDGSEDAGKMGAGVWCWHAKAQHWGIRVGREDEGSNSKRPEMEALASFLPQAQEGNEISEEEMEAKFWRRRPDRLAINQQGRILYLNEFKGPWTLG